MNVKNTIFITKDAMHKNYLPTYGNTLWETPNICDLAKKGTVFTRYYTGAPSTIMSNICMFTGKNAYECGLEEYTFSHLRYEGESFWSQAEKRGFETHIIWDSAWRDVFRAEERYYCYGDGTTIHYLDNIRQGVGAHYIHKGFLQRDDGKTNTAIDKLETQIKQIFADASKPIFLWLHIPHVINGCTGYGSDIDAFDRIVGMARTYFDDDAIFISADHGNMNGAKGKLCYGHHVYEPSICIPLITPKINDFDICSQVTSNIDIQSIIFDHVIPGREYVYSDSAFCGQPNRKLAIISGNYKYIYNKKDKSEELYDVVFDPNENCNLIKDYVFDHDRNVITPLRELYFYPYWDKVEEMRQTLRKEKDRIWRRGSLKTEVKSSIKTSIHSLGYDQIKFLLRRKK